MADMSRNGGFTNVQPPMEVDFIFPAAGGGGTAATAVWFNDAHEAALWKKPYAPMLHAGGATTTTTSSHGSSTKMYCEPYGVHGTTQMPTHPSNHLYPNPDGAVTSASAAAAAVAAGSAGGVAVKVEAGTCSQVKWFRNIDPNMDPKRLKRVISNRISAHKSRMKKLQYVTEMEKKVKSLEKEIAELSPQVALHEHHHNLLKMENSFLQQTLSTRTNEKIVMEGIQDLHQP
ncbi:transcription factor RF2b isoform X2 [Malania oleifera]|uniref:transcription factor RF2b isoform X2 n=1 Tax=Malania oleifera TaxID=397392 RepID=UPI0025ADB1B5|nr:transcription factor RF2b isoform X2 [Malania oleifera]